MKRNLFVKSKHTFTLNIWHFSSTCYLNKSCIFCFTTDFSYSLDRHPSQPVQNKHYAVQAHQYTHSCGWQQPTSWSPGSLLSRVSYPPIFCWLAHHTARVGHTPLSVVHSLHHYISHLVQVGHTPVFPLIDGETKIQDFARENMKRNLFVKSKHTFTLNIWHFSSTCYLNKFCIFCFTTDFSCSLDTHPSHLVEQQIPFLSARQFTHSISGQHPRLQVSCFFTVGGHPPLLVR